MKPLRHIFKSASCLAVGLVLARGAQATVTLIGDTTITFDNSGLGNNTQIPIGYGSGSSSTNAPVAGVVVGGSGSGLGTPDVSLNWQSTSTGRGGPPIQYQYYKGGPWDAALMYNSAPGNSHDITFSVPSFASVQLNSFNFHPYNNDSSTFSYTVTVKDAINPANILSTHTYNVPANATKDSITLNNIGALGQSLTLEITRNTSLGAADPYSMALDDLSFSEVTPEPGTTALLGLGLTGMGLWAKRRKQK